MNLKMAKFSGNGEYSQKGDYLENCGGQQARSWCLTRWQHQSRKLWMLLCIVAELLDEISFPHAHSVLIA
jgi:hypothetical protein